MRSRSSQQGGRMRIGAAAQPAAAAQSASASAENDDDLLSIRHNDVSLDDGPPLDDPRLQSAKKDGFRVYRERWLMLFYLSLLNMLSDWTGLSVAPIATITKRSYSSDDDYVFREDNDAGSFIQPEALVTVFLAASAVGTACEPWVLSRLGLRNTIVFGAFVNLVGSLVKSGGLPPFLSFTSFHHGVYGARALYFGFGCVGFAQPLFQCTPALLSASWFAEEERTLATSIALNANQLGVGLAFLVGALWVQSPSQIANYFSLLSFLSLFGFVGTCLQLKDAPPSPPSGSSRVMRGTMEISIRDLIQKASSSLVAKAGRYDFDQKRLWGYYDEESDAVSQAGSSLDASAQSLLQQHFSTPARRKTEYEKNAYTIGEEHLLVSPYSVGSDESICEGAEPVLMQTPHKLEVNIRDDQLFVAFRACFARKGFSHAVVVFTASGLVMNVLSTYLDYLIRGEYFADEEEQQTGEVTSGSIAVAVIGALFQLIIMASSILIGKFTDMTRSYFAVAIIMLVLSVLALAECGVGLDEDHPRDVRWALLLVAGLVGPLLPISAELAVEAAYPLSENTVLVILQLVCSLASAAFIPIFQAAKFIGADVSRDNEESNQGDDGALVLGTGRPPYTFSFYLLILITGVATVYFATFDGKYLRLEAEQYRKNRAT
mmetsp:Transcript_32309/g.77229  ORF Transcript_32309/g.77229 Transcript_32309/m.77229 type:complete len:660 (+) Transcript_32309:142-2121(+)